MADIRTPRSVTQNPVGEEGDAIRPVPTAVLREVYRDDQTLVPEVRAIAWVSASRATQLISAHAHSDLFEIAYFTRGAADWWIDQQVYRVVAGHVFVTKPGERHGALDEMFHPHEHLQIQLRLPVPKDAAGFVPGELDELATRLGQIDHNCFPGSPHIEQCMRRILLEHRHPQEYSSLVVRSAVCDLLVTVLRDHANSPDVLPRRRTSTRLQPVLDWIDLALPDITTAEQIATEAGMSTRQFYRLFKQELDLTPNEYLVERRIETAKQLLADGKLSVTDIAFRVGFSSSQYFSTVFKAQTGITPTRFRNSHRTE